MSEETDETYRENLRRANVFGAGDYWIGGGLIVAGLAIVLTLITLFVSGGSFVLLSAVPVAMLAVIIGYLKKIAAAAQASL